MANSSDRARVEAALRDSEQRFRMLFERNAAGMNIADLSGRYLQVNQAYCDFLGRSSSELLQLSHADVVHPEDLCEVHANMSVGGAKDVVRRFVRKDGTTVWGFISAVLVQPEGGPPYWVGVIQDITAHKRAEELLRESEQRFRIIANDNPAYLWMTSTRQPYESFINRALASFLGVEKTELHHSRWSDYVHPEDREWVLAMAREKIAGGLELSQEFRMRRHDGEYRFVSSQARPRRAPTGEVLGYAGVLFDITERQIAQESLLAARDALEKELAERSRAEEQVLLLTERLISAHEEERTRIARELHDDLSQQLAATALLLSSIKGDLQADDTSLRERIEQAGDKLTQLANVVRNISHALHPAILEYAGLTAALQTHCTEFTALTGIEIELHAEESFKELPPAVSLCLYRIAQEALQNIAKHAAVRSAQIELVRYGSSVSLAVRDRGRGFERKRVTDRASGLGILNMKERARSAGGNLELKSAPGEGTRITATVPVSSQALQATH